MAKKSKLAARIKSLEAEIARLLTGKKAKRKKSKAKKTKVTKTKAKKTKAAKIPAPAKTVKKARAAAKKKPSRKKRVTPPPMDQIMAAGEPEFVQPLDVV